MKKSISLDKVNGSGLISNARNSSYIQASQDSVARRRYRPDHVHERYCITIKPQLCRSSSLSDLAPISSDFTLDFFKRTNKLLRQTHIDSLCDNCGDGAPAAVYCAKHIKEHCMPNNNKKKRMDEPTSYGSKFATEYLTSGAEHSSTCSLDDSNMHKRATFPFKSTPSGNLKVQSNQVVFQSSTVGVLLADPTQAKVKVKFEGKAAGDPEDVEQTFSDSEVEIQDYQVTEQGPSVVQPERKNASMSKKQQNNIKLPSVREDKGKDLSSLGYGLSEPVDWTRVQLPKKQDLFQEFYRRLHNRVGTDTIIRIGKNEFHCHRAVLQIYSEFFDMNLHRDIDLPPSSITAETFQIIYDWMIFSGPESNKILKRDNVLDLFCAAQYLAIKDLEEQCWSFIVDETLFTEDTAFSMYREAREKGISPVMELMIPRVMRFFLPLVASKDFLTLEADEVMTILKSNYICVTSEIEVLMAGVRWLYGDWSSRHFLAVDVMKCVRFGLISPWQLVDIKRNPDNGEILEIVNDPEVQQMVDDGLAYVIIKYWYGNNSNNYYHWIDVLGLTEPADRNWMGEEKNHVTYKDFLKYLEQYMVPKDQMYQQMTMMLPPRRSDEVPAGLRSMDKDNRPKFDFPLPVTLKGLSGDKEKFPTMSEFFENRKKSADHSPPNLPHSSRSPHITDSLTMHMQHLKQAHDHSPPAHAPPTRVYAESAALHMQHRFDKHQRSIEEDDENVQKTRRAHEHVQAQETAQAHEPPERDSSYNLGSTHSDSNSTATDSYELEYMGARQERRQSAAATYLAAAVAKHNAQIGGPSGHQSILQTPRAEQTPRLGKSDRENKSGSAQLSMFDESKESLAKLNMNKLSASILGPSNKNYIADGSLFDWEKETVLVFGGIDPHTPYGTAKNNGRSIYRFDPVANLWEVVGELPEPRHHHSVAFLRGRVYLVGGADPRDDDIRGKSVVMSTVWSFEPVSRSWHSESGLSISRKNFGLVVHKMSLYAIGGQDKKGRVLRSVEKFDPRTQSWVEVRSMGVARMAVASTKYREYIWVAGGMTGEKKKPVCKVVECYNSKTDEWTEIHSLRFPRCFSTMFSMNDKLFIIGGAGKILDKDKTASSVGAIDVWDWKDRDWKLHTEMSIPRHGHALAYLGPQLIIIGGVTTIYMRALSNVESYCCERSAWIRGVAPLPTPLSGHGAVTLPPASLM